MPVARIAFLSHRKTAEPRPLLRSPYSGAGQAAISSLVPGWAGPALEGPRHQQITDIVINGRIGGSFWLANSHLPNVAMNVAVLSADLAQAKQLWSDLLSRLDAASLAIFYPPARELNPLLAEITSAGAHVAPIGNPHPMLDIANAVYAAGSSDLGSLAALAGIPAFEFCDGAFRPSSPQYESARICKGTLYTDPYTGRRSGIDEIAEILGDWRRMFQRNRAIGSCTGIALWKRRRMAQLLHNGEAAPSYYRSANAALNGAAVKAGAVAAWTTRFPANLAAAAQSKTIPLFRLEDGFIRSAGLGSGLHPPASIVADRQGIYFDPAQPSDLETLLATTSFSESSLQRASRLIHLLTSKNISKYGAGGQTPALRARPGQRIILVPGQVADDLSLQLGTSGAIRSNLALLHSVRGRNPNAYIIYRPHPDVLAGHRNGAIPNPVTLGFADQLVPGGSIAALIAQVDEVHTMTSLAGFEALYHGRVVETYGQPFYAGWGLTRDHLPVARRQRRLQLEELVAGALILYPHYVDPATGLPCGPEMLIARLEQPELWRPSLLMRLRRLQGTCRRIVTGWADPRVGFDA